MKHLRNMYHATSVCFFALLLKASKCTYINPSPLGNSWAPCSFAVEQLGLEGNGSTTGSCLACNPTTFKCPFKCQSLLDAVYKECDGVYAPQDFYFDPARTLDGYWNDHFSVLRVQAARCGCNTSPNDKILPFITMATTILIFILM
ncbi:hypothetical protein Plhal304r1_c017g0062361 [Plasmopara halstedii]